RSPWFKAPFTPEPSDRRASQRQEIIVICPEGAHFESQGQRPWNPDDVTTPTPPRPRGAGRGLGGGVGVTSPARGVAPGLRNMPLRGIFQSINPPGRLQSMPEPVPSEPTAQEPWLEAAASQDFGAWLDEHKLSLAFTTYQTAKLFLIGLQPDGRV